MLHGAAFIATMLRQPLRYKLSLKVVSCNITLRPLLAVKLCWKASGHLPLYDVCIIWSPDMLLLTEDWVKRNPSQCYQWTSVGFDFPFSLEFWLDSQSPRKNNSHPYKKFGDSSLNESTFSWKNQIVLTQAPLKSSYSLKCFYQVVSEQWPSKPGKRYSSAVKKQHIWISLSVRAVHLQAQKCAPKIILSIMTCLWWFARAQIRAREKMKIKSWDVCL